jgi:hypothetical protein
MEKINIINQSYWIRFSSRLEINSSILLYILISILNKDSNKISKNSNDHESIYIPTDSSSSSSSSSSSDENSNNNNLNEEEQQTNVKIKPQQQSTTPSSSNYLNTTKLINFASGFKIPKRARFYFLNINKNI